MKSLIASFLLGLGLLLPAAGQTISQNSSATTTGDKTDVSNIGFSPAIGWRLVAWATPSVTAYTIQLDCAPDNGSGAPGSYTACGGAVDGTTNPASVSSGPLGLTIALKIPTPHIAVNLTSITGTGTVRWSLTGLFGAFNVPSTVSGGGGGGGTTPVTTACTAQAEVALSGTGYTTIVAGSGSTVVSLCNIIVTSASGGTPSVNTFNLAFGTCAGSPTEIAQLAGVTGYTDQFFGSLAGAAGAAFCVKESVANSDKVTVTYLQH